ncbi:hypothetical protein NQZ68_032643 [Dissostichus eleginoides]|nr:hypothetical protein NQZ68_032643 [Dissostichus eleginoides]
MTIADLTKPTHSSFECPRTALSLRVTVSPVAQRRAHRSDLETFLDDRPVRLLLRKRRAGVLSKFTAAGRCESDSVLRDKSLGTHIYPD